MFVLPKGVYEVALKKPLGIAFEEVEPGRGVLVTELVEGGSAVEDGTIQPGDIVRCLIPHATTSLLLLHAVSPFLRRVCDDPIAPPTSRCS